MTDASDDLEISFRELVALRAALQASTERGPAVYPRTTDMTHALARLPRWTAGIGAEFDQEYEGFQGVTVLGGPAGSGKSQWALACALSNAVDGACVVYFDAENAAGEVRERMVRWFGGELTFTREFPRLKLNMHWAEIDHTHNWKTMMLYVQQLVLHTHKRLLVVLDSVQTIADECDPDRGMLHVTAELYRTMNRIVKQTYGRANFLVLSELNKEGGIKGGSGMYRGTMVMSIAREQEQGKDCYRLSLIKNRNGPTPGDIGLYDLDYWRCRFRKVPVS